MNILVTLNAGYIGPLTTMLRSLVDTNPQERFIIYVAHSSLTDKDFSVIESSIDINRCSIINVRVDDNLFANASCKNRLSKETYYRLYAAEFLPHEIDRILYLDPDIVINGRLDKFYYTDMGGHLFAAASHNNKLINSVNVKRLKMAEHSKYCNAGVMLINLSCLRPENRTKELMDYIKNNNRRLLLEDQDVFNALYSGRTLYLDPNIINMDEMTFLRLKRKLGYSRAMAFVKSNTLVIHFNGKCKPWNGNYKGNLGKFYFKYTTRRDDTCDFRQNAV